MLCSAAAADIGRQSIPGPPGTEMPVIMDATPPVASCQLTTAKPSPGSQLCAEGYGGQVCSSGHRSPSSSMETLQCSHFPRISLCTGVCVLLWRSLPCLRGQDKDIIRAPASPVAVYQCGQSTMVVLLVSFSSKRCGYGGVSVVPFVAV